MEKLLFKFLQPNKTLFAILPRVFDCTCFIQHKSPLRTKLDDKAIQCVFLGYSPMSKAYQCYDPNTRHSCHSMDVTFLEGIPFITSQSPLVESLVSPTPKDLLRPVPIFESSASTSDESLLPVVTSSPIHHYSWRPRAPPPLPKSSPLSGITSPAPPLHRSTRIYYLGNRYGFSFSTYPISQYISYYGLSGSCGAFSRAN